MKSFYKQATNKIPKTVPDILTVCKKNLYAFQGEPLKVISYGPACIRSQQQTQKDYRKAGLCSSELKDIRRLMESSSAITTDPQRADSHHGHHSLLSLSFSDSFGKLLKFWSSHRTNLYFCLRLILWNTTTVSLDQR